jgi:hypothetical protein
MIKAPMKGLNQYPQGPKKAEKESEDGCVPHEGKTTSIPPDPQKSENTK